MNPQWGPTQTNDYCYKAPAVQVNCIDNDGNGCWNQLLGFETVYEKQSGLRQIRLDFHAIGAATTPTQDEDENEVHPDVRNGKQKSKEVPGHCETV